MSLFRSLFRSKKANAAANKENERLEEMNRQINNRRSFHSQAPRTTRFSDDTNVLSATAAYHTNNVVKHKKGPKSCPGGYRDESDGSNNSLDGYDRKKRQPRGKRSNARYTNIDVDRRKTTSEYGSSDPSPIEKRHAHYDVRLDESDNDDDFDDNAQLLVMENTCRHYLNKWKEAEQKRRDEKRRMKELEKERDDMQKVLFRQIEQLNKEKERYKKKAQQLETKMAEMRMVNYNQQFAMAPFMGSTSNTPTTCPMDSTGAGESLVQPGDMSLLQLQSMVSLRMDSSHLGNLRSPFANIDENDEVKNFRDSNRLSLEIARRGGPEKEAISSMSSSDSTITLSETTEEKENAPLRNTGNRLSLRSI